MSGSLLVTKGLVRYLIALGSHSTLGNPGLLYLITIVAVLKLEITSLDPVKKSNDIAAGHNSYVAYYSSFYKSEIIILFEEKNTYLRFNILKLKQRCNLL